MLLLRQAHHVSYARLALMPSEVQETSHALPLPSKNVQFCGKAELVTATFIIMWEQW